MGKTEILWVIHACWWELWLCITDLDLWINVDNYEIVSITPQIYGDLSTEAGDFMEQANIYPQFVHKWGQWKVLPNRMGY